jgi:hypothetical protein
VVAGAFATASSASASQKTARLSDRGSADDQRACTPDVWRLCLGYIPNEPAIVGCLKRSIPSLSPACRAVFQSKSMRAKQHRRAEPRRQKNLTTGSIPRNR